MDMVRKLRSFCARFVKAQKGNVAIIFGLTMIPLMVLIGGLVDYGMAVKTKSQLTVTLDSAMLAAMMKYSEDQDVDFEKIILDYVDKNYSKSGKALHGVILEVATPTLSDEGEMSSSIRVKVPTSFLKFVNFDNFEFTVSSSAMVGGSSIEVALVLDNTGSMRGSKIAALKEAANDLLEIVMPEGGNNDGKVKFALIPFADYVNIGTEHADEEGLDIPETYSVMTREGGERCWNTYPDSTYRCVNNPRVPGTCYNDGVPYDCMKWNGRTCTGDRGEPVRRCEEREAEYKTYKWFGCVGSREHDLNVRDADYDTGVPGMMDTWNWCRQIAPVTRLTADRDSITTAISRMRSQRNTYIPAGLIWGWRALSPIAPFADGSPYSDGGVRKVIVLMTDGANTKSAWGKWNGLENDSRSWKRNLGRKALNNQSDLYGHNGSNKSSANAITTELCNNIRAKGITVFTIAFDVEEGSDVEALMQGCAANGGQYFDADDNEGLGDAFKEIGLSLLNLRLSK